ncbi:threonylcarbamoyl-AMP synthase [Candidatus Amoebophilus asiaticus]|nr:threonylcarbamoyl-AMP synthase [Candidatus Amoebophilus asiaticus]
MLLSLHPENPSPDRIQKIADCLAHDGVIIYPTDTVYSIGCSIYSTKAIERICQIKGIKIQKANFSFICYDLSNISDFTLPIDNSIYKLMRNELPGPFTFILKANNKVPKIFKSTKKTVGIRVPDNEIPKEIVKELGNPLMSSSIHDDDKIIEYTTDPELIHEKYEKIVDIVVSGGFGGNIPSTVVDCTTDEPEIIREGKGILEEYLI